MATRLDLTNSQRVGSQTGLTCDSSIGVLHVENGTRKVIVTKEVSPVSSFLVDLSEEERMLVDEYTLTGDNCFLQDPMSRLTLNGRRVVVHAAPQPVYPITCYSSPFKQVKVLEEPKPVDVSFFDLSSNRSSLFEDNIACCLCPWVVVSVKVFNVSNS